MKKSIITLGICLLAACSPPNTTENPEDLIPITVARFNIKGKVTGPDGQALNNALVRVVSPHLSPSNSGATPSGSDILLNTNAAGEFETEVALTQKEPIELRVSQIGRVPMTVELQPKENLDVAVSLAGNGPVFEGKVAYTRTQGNVSQIFLMSPDGTGKQFLVNGATANWHPDGKSLAYVGSDGVYTISEDGSNASRVWQGNNAFFPTWSPPGDALAFSYETSTFNFDIFRMSANGGDLTQLSEHQANEIVSDWRDGTLLFSSPAHAPVDNTNGPSPGGTSGFYDGQTDIYSMQADGSEQKHISQSGVSDSGARFSPDGSKIAFIRSGILMLMNSDGTNLKQISDYHSAKSTAQVTVSGTLSGAPSWSKDGKYILASRVLQLCECPDAQRSDLFIYKVDEDVMYRATFTGDVFAADWYQ